MNFIKIFVLLFASAALYSLTESSVDVVKADYSNISLTSDSLIYWKSNYKLKWSDFKGKVDSLSTNQAVTTTNIDLNAQNLKDSIIVNVPTYFVKYSSWTKKNSGSENLLNHEQLHFDIAELVARKLRQKLTELTYTDVKLAYKSIQAIYNDYHGRVWNSYDIYDIETKHGIVIEKQKEWEAKIAKELKELKSFSSSKVVIKKKKN